MMFSETEASGASALDSLFEPYKKSKTFGSSTNFRYTLILSRDIAQTLIFIVKPIFQL